MKTTLIPNKNCVSQCNPRWRKGQIVRRIRGEGRDAVVLVTKGDGSSPDHFSGVLLWGQNNVLRDAPHYDTNWLHEKFELYEGAIELRNC